LTPQPDVESPEIGLPADAVRGGGWAISVHTLA
jgi:hypothetical protein